MLVEIIRLYTPGFIKKKKLSDFFQLTADAFGCDPPDLRGLSLKERLVKYAQFTGTKAEEYIESGRPITDIKSRLYQNSYSFGQTVRRNLRIIKWEDAVSAIKTIYKLIGIDFELGTGDEFSVKRCFFSNYYNCRVCRLISSVDDGLAAGLTNGGKLLFMQRITEGGSCCKGFLTKEPV